MEKSHSNEKNQPSPQDEESKTTEFWRDTVIEQIIAIRDSGLTNMFDVKAVFEIAMEKDFYALADFVFMNTPGYSKFILTGDREQLLKISMKP